MDEAEFWRLIDLARDNSASCISLAKRLTKELQRRDPAEIVRFQEIFSGCTDRAYRADLWDIYSIINGGCGDDGFEYFRCWLISRGKDVFERVLADPTVLPDLLASTIPWQCEELLYCAMKAFKAATGKEAPHEIFVTPPVDLVGDLTPEDELEDRYPAVWKRWQELEEE